MVDKIVLKLQEQLKPHWKGKKKSRQIFERLFPNPEVIPEEIFKIKFDIYWRDRQYVWDTARLSSGFQIWARCG